MGGKRVARKGGEREGKETKKKKKESFLVFFSSFCGNERLHSSSSSWNRFGRGDRRGEGGADMGFGIFSPVSSLNSCESRNACISGKARSRASFLALTYSIPMVSQSSSSLNLSVLFRRLILWRRLLWALTSGSISRQQKERKAKSHKPEHCEPEHVISQLLDRILNRLGSAVDNVDAVVRRGLNLLLHVASKASEVGGNGGNSHHSAFSRSVAPNSCQGV